MFLRKKLPHIITKIEEDYLYYAIDEWSHVKHFRIDIQKNKIVIYISENVKKIMEVFFSRNAFFQKTSKSDSDDLTNQLGHYQAMLRFTLIDSERRYF